MKVRKLHLVTREEFKVLQAQCVLDVTYNESGGKTTLEKLAFTSHAGVKNYN